MSIKQLKPDLWLLDVRYWKDGKEYRKREEVQGGKKAAEARSHEVKKELRERAEKEPRSLKCTTFEHIIDYYLARNSIDDRSQHYFETLKKDLGNTPISEMRDRFDRYLLLLKKTKVKHTDRFFTNNTLNRYLAWSKAAFNCAVRGGIVKENPLQYFQKLPARPRDRMLNEDQKKTFLDIVKKEAPHIYPIVLYSMQVPCRSGELHLLQRTDYNMVNNTIHVPAEMTKMKRACIKPVPENCKEYFQSIPVECPYLFYRREGERFYPIGNFRKSWMKCLKLAGIENYRFHDQRRGAYTDLLLKGNAPHVVMQVSGHASDMSKVYFGRNEMNAAKSITFNSKPDTSTGHLKVATA
jgi:integrase